MKRLGSSLSKALVASFALALKPAEGMVSPVALLWTDEEGQWLPLVPALRAINPWIYTFGKYDPEARTGPAIWLKCIVDRTLPEAPPEGEAPILYLPWVRRQDLRAAADCPTDLQPLVELQYRGKVWHQSNGHDWTVRAFLVSAEGLGLDIAADRRTEEAMRRALPLLADLDASSLRGHRLDAEDFDRLAVADPVRDLLRWLDQPEAFEAETKGSRWDSFRAISQSTFGLDPEVVTPSEVAGMLMTAEPALDLAWSRFKEAPELYGGVAKWLKTPAGAGQGSLVFEAERDPRLNEAQEAALRKELEGISVLSHSEACTRIQELEKVHGERRNWVWARLGWSSWAVALGAMARLAQRALRPAGGGTLEDAAALYAKSGWETDAAAMEALAPFRNGADATLLTQIVRTLYQPWLEASARHFQTLLATDPSGIRSAACGSAPQQGTCLMFVDGLRFDLARAVTARLEDRSLRVNVGHRMAALPSVTSTCKPAVAPLQGDLEGGDGTDFAPLVKTRSGRKALTSALLWDRMEAAGVELLEANEIRIPAGTAGGGWTECGSIDSMGHSLQADLVHQLSAEVEKVAARAASLLDAGWQRVTVVTDHGWLLLPGGLPKIDLPSYLVGTKWARCALVKGQPDLAVPVAAWHWNTQVQVASPPGIACFRAGEQYAHGGISLQECVIPVLTVSRGEDSAGASIQSIEWRGMRCRVKVESGDPKVRADLRTQWRQPESSIVLAAKELGPGGEVSLAVRDDIYEGAPAYVVILDAQDRVIATNPTTVGEKP
ncbi:MAG: BREX-1 system phosphatase PglZ type B [Candidatus Bipolaricaulota bacterium]